MKIEKTQNLAANFFYITEYVMHIKNLKQALNHRLVLKKLHRIIKFNQKAGWKPYIDMNTDLGKEQKWFWKRLFNLMNNGVFGKIMENGISDLKILKRIKTLYYKVFQRKFSSYKS